MQVLIEVKKKVENSLYKFHKKSGWLNKNNAQKYRLKIGSRRINVRLSSLFFYIYKDKVFGQIKFMSRYNPHIHHRKSIRMKGYDYAQAGLYFITICCQDRICRFGHVENGEMVLNEYGNIANDEWLRTTILRPIVKIARICGMPNHIHG